MEYIVIGLLIVIIGLLWFKQPDKMKNVFTESVITRVEKNKGQIARGVYNKLPSELKEDLPEGLVKASVEEVIEVSIEVIKDGLR
jgi:hypothetical protein